MQFRPVGIEGAGEELAPEGANSSKSMGRLAAVGRGAEGCGREGYHDAPACLLAAYAAQSALFGAESQLSPDLLKQGFNCRDRPDMVSAP
jgi:hypothetical protein